MADVSFDTYEEPEPKALKKARVSYKSQLSAEQLAALQHYFTHKSRYLSHGEKKRLSEKLGVDPFLLNKWFAGERGRYNREKKGQVSKKRKQELKTPIANDPLKASKAAAQ